MTSRTDTTLFNVGIQGIKSGYTTQPEQLSAFAAFRLMQIASFGRAEASVNILRGTWLRNYVARVGLGAELLDDRLDISAYYRPALIQYQRAANDTWLEHALGGTFWWEITDRISAQLGGEIIQGMDVGVLIIQSFLTWRPL